MFVGATRRVTNLAGRVQLLAGHVGVGLSPGGTHEVERSLEC